MSTTPLFPLPEGLEITALSETPKELLVRVTSNRQTSCCPLCGAPSSAIHSYYRRHPLDLPCVGRPIRLLLTVKKFFCREPLCKRKIFTERLSDLIEVSSRLTKRLRTAVQEIGFATCGKGGERLSSKLGIKISDSTLLWSLHLLPTPSVGQVRVVGLDDWIWRRGKRWGSIIVDLETHKVIDLLPERTVESVITWLSAHPEVEIVSRDRGGTYVDGATQGAPLAIQVCDRWHVLKNLGEAVEAFFIRARIRLPEASARLVFIYWGNRTHSLILFYTTTTVQISGFSAAEMAIVSAHPRIVQPGHEQASDRRGTPSCTQYGAEILPSATISTATNSAPTAS